MKKWRNKVNTFSFFFVDFSGGERPIRPFKSATDIYNYLNRFKSTCIPRFPASPLEWQRLVISCFQVAIWLKYRWSGVNPQYNQPNMYTIIQPHFCKLIPTSSKLYSHIQTVGFIGITLSVPLSVCLCVQRNLTLFHVFLLLFIR